MKCLAYFGKKLEHLCCNLYKSFKSLIKSSLFVFFYQINPFWIQLAYFLLISLLGYLALKISTPRTTSSSSSKIKDIDIFFTSVSATTVSSMSTVEMEAFSNTQLIIMTTLMLVGGEVFTSMLGLRLERSKFRTPKPKPSNSLELVLVSDSGLANPKQETHDLESDTNFSSNDTSLKDASMKSLAYVVLVYLLVIHIGGSSLVAMYTGLIPNARETLTKKGISVQTFSVFTVVSTFANCGFVPTNENMIVFKKNSGLLLLLIPLTLLGNTLFAPSLRFLIWVLEKITKRVEYRYILRNTGEMGYSHLMSSVQSWFLFLTVLGFIVLQLIVFCCMEWNNSQGMDGLSWVEKLVAVLFQVVSTRHSGESVFDLSAISPAILVIFIVMMYLPPYTSFLPVKQQEEELVPRNGRERKNEKKTLFQDLLFSQLSYLVIFIVLICVVEREKLKTDPLNFNVLNITLEVISAHGNVGYSTGYGCARARQVNPNITSCKDAWFGLVGKWSNFGKFIIIIVMFFGRLKKFSINAGKAWKLS
ncbi:sodium transporter HKT1 [Ricinus communis]|uniref:High-affinity potassium uptake transporter n=1 Tax=Ricinus communis TaxID=3988 RepID=A0A384ZPA4_RICCO|nr:sodium transporter HKT1 [Ricinus communis]AXA98487.1 high-affinity potassium uptake transporter [Ricinus communis]|eukprot:XP_015576583.1 sodium transporter HKT1 [Ricinus communis]